ncbi:bifunctional (p)ppGpp synthetase/guanosine-3',5'-bis(diphosphate) 3'-pyrophosphohydrolase [Belnapia sp. T18]|uniref:Bifunctional (P)ppGpp synthetase/guanosine-3',5'-bis(Diphosphate) 3'-pyrophosphohydrolase n=1 Tax=Belnapia arida TaxID=2804533 RepID=A0ABS1U007_9PROT|nr:bifunctional (p)ppGpp synthetase/guanosine-3',5'-bis(diphosphate) 3'-pyrophosphohydrolase [Belnapia arida]
MTVAPTVFLAGQASAETILATILRAAGFAARVHATHRRKGAAAEPYVNHVLEVAEILAAAGAPPAAIVAGLLHDTVEDSDADPVPTTLADLEAAFGAEVSDDKSLPKEVRKGLQIRHAARASEAAKQVKLADKIANLRTMRSSPPIGWDHARRLEYVGWAGRVAAGAKGINPALDALFDETYRHAVARLAEEA